MSWQSQLRLVGDVLVAMLLGGAIGLERQLAEKPAGVRTHMLVAGASTLMIGMGAALVLHFATLMGESGVVVRSDPIRLVGAVVTGLSFLGAGTIFRAGAGRMVTGLTTAASILVCGGVGIAVALHLYVVAAGVVGLTLLTLRFVLPVESRLERVGGLETRERS